MRRAFVAWLAVLTAAVGLFLVGPNARAASPLDGKWTVTVTSDGQDITALLIEVSDKDGKPDVKVVSSLPVFKDVKVENVKGDAKSLHFTLAPRGRPFKFSAYAPKGKEKPEQLLGSARIGGNIEPIHLERSDLKEIKQDEAIKPAAGFDKLKKLRDEKEAKDRVEGLRKLIKDEAGKPLALAAAQLLVESDIENKEPADKLKPDADEYLKIASAYGPEMEQQAALQLARDLLKADKGAELAVEYARKAEKLTAADDTERTAVVLKVLARALKKADKADEAREVDARIEKIEARLDDEFARKAVPFKPQPPAGRTNKGDRVVLVELFTGAQCPPCVAADVAFDAALKVYKPADAVFLQYHLHIPGPDPLTNADSEARAKFYGKEIRGTPTAFVDGKQTDPLGGFSPDDSKESYGTLRKLIDEEMDREPGAQIKLKVTQAGDKIDIEADVADLKEAGEKVRLHFVIVEDVARYSGRNGQRLHHHVVRDFPGGAEGKALTEKSGKQTASVSIGELRKKLEGYLGKRRFLDDERPLKLEHLKVVAFIQDSESKKVLQAAQADVPAKKH
jgi:hypothetical protein